MPHLIHLFAIAAFSAIRSDGPVDSISTVAWLEGTTAVVRARGTIAERWRQVRIEQRLIIRISPGVAAPIPLPPSQPPQVLVSPRPRRPATCLRLAEIATVAQSGVANQILLVLRDHRLVAAELARTCSARDFYPGFYAEPEQDGQLCVGRDPIHSRAGATCLITRMQMVVP